jgi:hypothetical protein
MSGAGVGFVNAGPIVDRDRFQTGPYVQIRPHDPQPGPAHRLIRHSLRPARRARDYPSAPFAQDGTLASASAITRPPPSAITTRLSPTGVRWHHLYVPEARGRPPNRAGMPSLRRCGQIRGHATRRNAYQKLRRVERKPTDEAKPVDWKHRWSVRMHKVRHWHPSEDVHKVIYRGPYVKGSEGKPFIRGETTWGVIRQARGRADRHCRSATATSGTPCSVCVPSEPGRQRKALITNHRSITSSGG